MLRPPDLKELSSEVETKHEQKKKEGKSENFREIRSNKNSEIINLRENIIDYNSNFFKKIKTDINMMKSFRNMEMDMINDKDLSPSMEEVSKDKIYKSIDISVEKRDYHTENKITNPRTNQELLDNTFLDNKFNDIKKVNDVENKVRLATILGTWQSTLTDFKYLRKIWKDNTEEERLLGVSLTGQFGHKFFSGKEDINKLEKTLVSLRESARKINSEEAKKIGIQESAAITCVKPSGTVSQLVGVSSGMHPWHSKYYIRTVRGSKGDPISVFLKEVGIPVEDDVMKPNETYVFSFPIKAPEEAIVRSDLTAIDHLNTWLVYQRAWCEHKPSITVSVKEDEWMEVGSWVYKNFDEVSGISFLPHSDHSYKQAPYQEVTKEEYEELLSKMPKEIRWQDLSFYETEDGTSTNATLACTSDGNCELVDISA